MHQQDLLLKKNPVYFKECLQQLFYLDLSLRRCRHCLETVKSLA